MRDISLEDWGLVTSIGTMFALCLSILGYLLLGFPWVEGAVFGLILGGSISLYALLFITLLHRYILPHTLYGGIIAAFFSFVAGFLGSTSALYLVHDRIHIITLPWLIVSLIIGVLTYLVGVLMYQFVKTRHEHTLTQTRLLQSRLGSLERQLNPHFLFNALNSLAELIHQDPDKAETMVVELSTFLRSSMHEASLIPLRTEMENVRTYLALENIRFGNRIALELHLLPQELLIPKFSLQLLVENSLKHRFDPRMHTFTIRIFATHEKEHWSIYVEHEGESLTPEPFGIGLRNLQERLEHLCDGAVFIHTLTPPCYGIKVHT